MMNYLLLSILTIMPTQHQQWRGIKSESNSSFRSIVTDGTGFICVTGTRLSLVPDQPGKSAVVCSTDGGMTWIDRTPHQVSVTDYRCVSMPNAQSLVIASAGSPAVILRSGDQGVTWQTVYKNDRPEAFIDSLQFRDEKHGFAFGDPIDGRFLLLATSDGGLHWEPLSCSITPREREAGFAASNGLIAFPDSQTIVVGLGGGSVEGGSVGGGLAASRVLRSSDAGQTWQAHSVPCIPSGSSQGIFALNIRQDGFGIAVGGDYKTPNAAEGNVAITTDGGVTWRPPTGKTPTGFRSAVVFIPTKSNAATTDATSDGSSGYWITSGPNGTDISSDGEHWERLSQLGFHALTVSPKAYAPQFPAPFKTSLVMATGSEGRVAVLAGP